MATIFMLFAETAVEVCLAVVLGAATLRLVAKEIPNMMRRRKRAAIVEASASTIEEPQPERVSFVDGLIGEEIDGNDLEATLEEVLDWVVAAAPAGPHQPEACACVRPEGDGYIGVVRIDCQRSHHHYSVRGESRRVVALGILSECSSWADTPTGEPALSEHQECNRSCCPTGGRMSLLPPAPQPA